MALHPQTKEFLDGIAEQNPPGWHELTPEVGRDAFAGLTDLFGDVEPVASVENVDNLRVFTPEGQGPFPAVVYFHGGGWVLGDVSTHDALCRRLANAAKCVVVSVDYPRSPEAKFPVPFDESYAATKRVVEQAQKFNIDANRVAVAGDSAGANLAAAVALKARDESGPSIDFLLLIYPVTSSGCDTGTYDEFAEGFGLSKASMLWFWQQYLSSEEDGRNPYASPLMAESFSGLPPTHVLTAEYDVLREEGESFAAKLQEAGVPTTHKRYDGMIHGFVHCAGIFDVGKQSLLDAAAVLREHWSKNN